MAVVVARDGRIIPDATRSGSPHFRSSRAFVGDAYRLLPSALGSPLGARFTISPTSNRQGLRLAGGGAFPHALSLSSLGVLPGAIQLPPDGQPILLVKAGTKCPKNAGMKCPLFAGRKVRFTD